MSAMSIRLPESLHRNAGAFADREGVSVNQLVATALAEKLAALGAEDFFKERAARGSRTKFDRALALMPVVPPEEGESLVQTAPRRRSKATKG